MPLEEKLEISFVLFLWVEAAGCPVDVCVFWLVVSEVSCCVVVRCSYHDCRNPECSLQKAFLTPHGHCCMAFGQPVAVSPVHHLKWRNLPVHDVEGRHRDFGLWRVRFPPCLVRPGRRLPVQGLSEGSLGFLGRLPAPRGPGTGLKLCHQGYQKSKRNLVYGIWSQ